MNKIKRIFGLINLPSEDYSPPTSIFKTSNIKQIKKILSIAKEVYIALCITPPKNAYKEGLIKEIVVLESYKSLSNQLTTGMGLVKCNSIFEFKEFSRNREFFQIRPHSQLIIKQISNHESNNIIRYMERIKHEND